MPNEANPSTQLRALEGEIGKLADVPSSIRKFRKSKLCDEAITIAKELEAERDDWRKRAEEWRLSAFEKKNHEATLRTENATLKRRLDEAIKGLRHYTMWTHLGTDTAKMTLHRITEIDKL